MFNKLLHPTFDIALAQDELVKSSDVHHVCIRDTFHTLLQAPQNYSHTNRTSHIMYRNQLINRLQTDHSIVMLIAGNLNQYMNKMKDYKREHPHDEPVDILPDGKFNHMQQVQERLRFLR